MDPKVGGLGPKSGREIIHIQVGRAGNAVGHEFIRDLCEEHQIEYQNAEYRGICNVDDHSANLDVFFNEASPYMQGSMRKERWIPRAILVDLNMQDLAQITSGPLGHMYRPENIVGNDEGSGNCYAKAFHTEGPDVADVCLEHVRKEAERCNCLQGVQFVHSTCGGTGSGLTGLLMKTLRDYLDRNSKCIMQSFTLCPAPNIVDIVMETYNAALSLQDLLEYCDQCFLYDNAALTEIVQKSMGHDVPKMRDINNIVALCMSGLTSCLRFRGPLNADLRKLNTNLVPFKNAHFLISSFAPLHSETGGKYRSCSVLDLAQQMLMKDNVTVKCDPLNPGDPRQHILKSRLLASWASWRGGFATEEVDKTLYMMSKPGSRFDQYFPDWIPNPIASNVCVKPHCDVGESVVFVSNNTSVHQVFDRIIQNWDAMFDHKAFLHFFENDGISREDMKESRNILQYISEQYCEFARREDKFLDDSRGTVQINHQAIENDEQERIARELKDLSGPVMCIEHVAAPGGAGRH